MKFILVSKLFTDYVLNSNSNYVFRSKCEFLSGELLSGEFLSMSFVDEFLSMSFCLGELMSGELLSPNPRNEKKLNK